MNSSVKENMKSIREQFGKAVVDIGDTYPEVVVLTADLKYPTRTNYFADKYPERFIDVGIAEQNLVGVASGLATCGMIPLVCDYANFLCLRASEQIRNDIAYTYLNVKIAALSSGLTFGVGGSTHQSFEDVALMRAIPNLTVIVPSDALETEKAVKAAIKYEGPVLLRVGRDEEYIVYQDDYDFEIGKAVTLREGSDITLIANGPMVYEAVEASKILANLGITAAVLNMHTVKPIDKEAILKAAETSKAIITIEEHNVYGGLGSAVLEVLRGGHTCPVEIIGIPDVFPIIGPTEELRKYYGLHYENIVDTAKRILRTL